MTEQTIRTQILLGEGALARLRGSRVAVLGLGGAASPTDETMTVSAMPTSTLSVCSIISGQSSVSNS